MINPTFSDIRSKEKTLPLNNDTKKKEMGILGRFFVTFPRSIRPDIKDILSMSLQELLNDRSKPKKITKSLLLLPEHLSALEIMTRVESKALNSQESSFFYYLLHNFGVGLGLDDAPFLYILKQRIFSYILALKINLTDKIINSILENQDFYDTNSAEKDRIKELKYTLHLGISSGFFYISLYLSNGDDTYLDEASSVLIKIQALASTLEKLTEDPISKHLLNSITLLKDTLEQRAFYLPFWLLPSRMAYQVDLFPPALQHIILSLPTNLKFYDIFSGNALNLLKKELEQIKPEIEQIEPKKLEQTEEKIDFEHIFKCIKYLLTPIEDMSSTARKIEIILTKLEVHNNFKPLLDDIPLNFPVISMDKYRPLINELKNNLEKIFAQFERSVKCMNEGWELIEKHKLRTVSLQTEKEKVGKIINYVIHITALHKEVHVAPCHGLHTLYKKLEIVLAPVDKKRMESLKALIPSSIKALYPGQKGIDILAIYLRQVVDEILEVVKEDKMLIQVFDMTESLLLITFNNIKLMFNFESDPNNFSNTRTTILNHFKSIKLNIDNLNKEKKEHVLLPKIKKNIEILSKVIETFGEVLSEEIRFIPNHPLGALITSFGNSSQLFDKGNPLCHMWIKQTLRCLTQNDGREYKLLDTALANAANSVKDPNEIKSISFLRKKLSDSTKNYLTLRTEIIEILKQYKNTKMVKIIHEAIKKIKNLLPGLVSAKELRNLFTTHKGIYVLVKNEFIDLRKILISLEIVINHDLEGVSLPINQFEMIESEKKNKRHPIQPLKKPEEIEVFKEVPEVEVIQKTTLWTLQLEQALSSLIASSLKNESKEALQQCIVYTYLIDQYQSQENQPYLNALGSLQYICLFVEQVSKACIYVFLNENINPSHNLSELTDFVQSIQGIKDFVPSFQDEKLLQDIDRLKHFISHTSRHYSAPHEENEYQPLIMLQKLSKPDEISQQLSEVKATGARILQLVDEVLSFICTKKQVKVIEKEKYVPDFSYTIELPPFNPSKITNNLPTIRHLKKIRIQIEIIEKTFFNSRSLIVGDTVKEILSVLEKIKSTSSETFNKSPLALSLLLCTKLGELIEHAMLLYISLKNPSFWETSYETSTTSRSIAHSHLINMFAENVETLSDSKFTLNHEQKKLLDNLTFILLQFNHYPHKSTQNKSSSSVKRLSLVFQALIELTATTGQERQIKDIVDKHVIAMEPMVLDIVSKVLDLLLKK